jgi:hypothetical protein
MKAHRIGDGHTQALPAFDNIRAKLSVAGTELEDFLIDTFSLGILAHYLGVLLVMFGVEYDLAEIMQQAGKISIVWEFIIQAIGNV